MYTNSLKFPVCSESSSPETNRCLAHNTRQLYGGNDGRREGPLESGWRQVTSSFHPFLSQGDSSTIVVPKPLNRRLNLVLWYHHYSILSGRVWLKYDLSLHNMSTWTLPSERTSKVFFQFQYLKESKSQGRIVENSENRRHRYSKIKSTILSTVFVNIVNR